MTALGRILLGTGLLLLLLNLSGLVLPLRHPELATAPTGFAPGDIVLPAQQVLAESQPNPDEARADYVRRVTGLVNRGMAHYWYSPQYNIHIPPHENWLLWLAGLLVPGFDNWEYIDHHRALERGVGLCSQHTIVLVGLLREAGFNAEIVNLDYHVIARVEVSPHVWWLADADYGVLAPYDLEQMQPQRVRQLYADYPDHWATLIHAYQQAPSQIAPSAAAWRAAAFEIERASYVLKWALPLSFLTAGLCLYRRVPAPDRRSWPVAWKRTAGL